jgi:hypothetical protein
MKKIHKETEKTLWLRTLVPSWNQNLTLVWSLFPLDKQHEQKYPRNMAFTANPKAIRDSQPIRFWGQAKWQNPWCLCTVQSTCSYAHWLVSTPDFLIKHSIVYSWRHAPKGLPQFEVCSLQGPRGCRHEI